MTSKRKIPVNLLLETNRSCNNPCKQIKLCSNNYKDDMESKDVENSKKDSMLDELLNDIDFDDFELDESSNSQNRFLDLSSWKRCIVDECDRDERTHDIILRGREDKTDNVCLRSNKPMVCRLQQAWTNCKINKNDIVSVLGTWNSDINCYCVSNCFGFAVVRPDLLISGTTVVSGLFCLRKAILSDRFKGIGANNKIMTIGSIVHELLQVVLRRKLTTLEEVKAASDQLLADNSMAFTLYTSQMNSDEARKEIGFFLDKIHLFVEQYVKGKMNTAGNKKDHFSGIIDNIQDIEENIWVPKLGLKGKVDVSVNVKQSHLNGAQPKYMPLELKTGRASFSSEHKGQLIIYQMMMSEIGDRPVDSGLLLYLREGVMREVKGSRNEQRDLILLRNELAYYLSKQNDTYANVSGHPAEQNTENFIKSDQNLKSEFYRISKQPELPEPISHHSACRTCPYNVLCSMYLNQDPEMMSSLGENHPLREIASLVTCHLTENHIEYFCHWVGLLALEEQDCRKSNQLKTLWLEHPEVRQMNGHAIIDLELDRNVLFQSEDELIHKFQSKTGDLMARGFSEGEYLIVSTEKRLAVAAGRVQTIEENAITICLERNLTDRYSNCFFILDKYESQTIASFNMANLGALLDDTESSGRLRKIIIDKVAPTFTKQLPKIVATDGKEILRSLNSIQRTAVLKALTSNEFLLLKGLPGTGKTQTLIAIIRLFVMMGKSILITSHTHSAVDNVLLRLIKCDKNIKFIRLGSLSRIKDELLEFSESVLTRDCHSAEEIKIVYDCYNIVGVTCLGASHPLLIQKEFDVCLVDESTQVFQSAVLRPLFSAKKFILVGDPDQLPPIVRSSIARNLGADESLFARLDSETATVALTIQYRMNKTITKLANDLTYCGTLKCANDSIATATIKLTSNTKIKWLQKLLSTHIDQSVCLLNTDNVYNLCIDHAKNMENSQSLDLMEVNGDEKSIEETTNTRLYNNYCEAAIILKILQELIESGVDGSMIGVIAPYVLQVELLKRLVRKKISETIEVNTVDQYQGRDKEIIIYSCTKTGSHGGKQSNSFTKKTEILADQRRLTVAITRAKHKLILIGDVNALDNYAPFKSLIQSMSGMNKIHVKDGQHGFNWSEVMKVLS